MLQAHKLLLIAAAGATTTAAVVLCETVIPAPRLLYPVLVITFIAGAAGIGSVLLPSPPTTHRPALLSVTAFAAGMALATIAFAVYTHFASLETENPAHRVAWPLFAVLFIATILLGVAVFSAATMVTAAIVEYRASRRRGHTA